MAGLEGIDSSRMEVIDALGGVRYTYDPGDRIAKPVIRHADFVPVARNEGGERVVDRVRFGMPVGPRLITNARSENLGSPAWRGLVGKPEHHCMAAVGYVIERDAKSGRSYRIQRRDGKLMVVAGLAAKRHYSFASTGHEYDDWGHVQVTAAANAFVAPIHDRFVVELPGASERQAWMAANGWQGLFVPAEPERYEMVPIAADVWKRRGDPLAVAPAGPPVRWT
ncbi:MAG: SOS response-associated peptidase family protein [Thermoplasmatota archaeon]